MSVGLITTITALISFVVTVVVGKFLIPELKKLKFGQTILDIGPSWHKSKQGTPTMGGIMFIIGVVVASLLGYLIVALSGHLDVFGSTLKMTQFFGGLIMALLFGGMGFIDDYIKVVKKRNLGLTAKQKILIQVLITAGYLTALYVAGDRATTTTLPFFGTVDLGIFYYPIMGILIVGIVNAVNLTDGIDGLATSVTFVVAVFFVIASSVLNYYGIHLLSAALAAACVGFLIYNVHPAKTFMGDTGSMFLGGMVVAMAFGIEMEFVLFLAGFVYCCEALSVILQVFSLKVFKKRIFKMSPIHHHFELCGFSENKIVVMFSLVTLVMCVLAFFGLKA